MVLHKEGEGDVKQTVCSHIPWWRLIYILLIVIDYTGRDGAVLVVVCMSSHGPDAVVVSNYSSGTRDVR